MFFAIYNSILASLSFVGRIRQEPKWWGSALAIQTMLAGIIYYMSRNFGNIVRAYNS